MFWNFLPAKPDVELCNFCIANLQFCIFRIRKSSALVE